MSVCGRAVLGTRVESDEPMVQFLVGIYSIFILNFFACFPFLTTHLSFAHTNEIKHNRSSREAGAL